MLWPQPVRRGGPARRWPVIVFECRVNLPPLAGPSGGQVSWLCSHLAAAGLQSLGRLGAWLLDDFEGALNAYLGEGVTISGLRGDWQGLNPVVRAARVELPAGSMERVLIELDWPETLLRSRWIMQRLFVERAELEVVRSGNGWGLAGPTREAQGIDWLGLINYTDEIRFRGRISVAGDPDSALDVEVLGFNRDGLHGFDIRAAGSSCGQDGDCAARLQWRRWPHRWSPPPAQRYLSLQGNLSLPLAYLGLPNLGRSLGHRCRGPMDRAQWRWRRRIRARGQATARRWQSESRRQSRGTPCSGHSGWHSPCRRSQGPPQNRGVGFGSAPGARAGRRRSRPSLDR